jgi:hypothetical protein
MNLYWIHHQNHTDIFSQGYVGVSNNVEKRWYDHKTYTNNAHLKHSMKKYGWDTLIKEVVLIADDDYCLNIEKQLRPSDKIGWNIVMGGGKPPSALGKKFVRSEEYRRKQSLSHKGKPAWNVGITLTEEQKAKQFKLADYMKDKVSPRKGVKHSKETIEKVRQSKLGTVMAEETKQKLSLANKGRTFKMVTCTVCGKEGGITGMKTRHFDRCTGLKPYKARVTIDGKRLWLGRFATKEQADMAIKNAQLGVK